MSNLLLCENIEHIVTCYKPGIDILVLQSMRVVGLLSASDCITSQCGGRLDAERSGKYARIEGNMENPSAVYSKLINQYAIYNR